MEIELQINKTVEENAAIYFEKGKKARSKIDGTKETLKKFSKKVVVEDKNVKKVKKIEAVKKHWYEKFRWFVTSEGFLVIGGRDATSNEIVIKKHTSEGDVVFHTDMAGSPFVIIKRKVVDEVKDLLGDDFSQADTIGEESLIEAASFCFAHSKAWKAGMQTAAVFYVNPDQVTKEAQSGEYLAKGSFMIRGKTTYVDPNPGFAIGLIGEQVIGAPRSAVSKWSKLIVEIEQGKNKASEVAKVIRGRFREEVEVDPTNDAIIPILPAGGCQVKKIRKRKK